ncbi:MAG: ABC transporter ATP-binding protein [Clostridiales bacterium]|jgi:peptide/nickel transport system ATP-binding protein|nr:ABC transporter ATP-binding protein [Clostridiales bacterium]
MVINMGEPLLRVENLNIRIRKAGRSLTAVEDVSFSLRPGGTLGIVGESGCGKSVTCLSILRLAPPNIEISGGKVYFEGRLLNRLSEREFDALRGRAFSMIFQDSISGLNPLMKIGRQVAEAVPAPGRVREGEPGGPVGRGGGLIGGGRMARRERRETVLRLLRQVRLENAEQVAERYPHELSGGQRQRVMIAIAIAAGPGLLIADEPTTALDVTTQREILSLLREIQTRTGMGMILISHDVGVIRRMCDDVLVMYSGQAVEAGSARDVLEDPRHPYTAGLVRSAVAAGIRGGALYAIEGTVASLEQRRHLTGCVFAERCEKRCERAAEPPGPYLLEGGARMCRCFLAHAPRRGGGGGGHGGGGDDYEHVNR